MAQASVASLESGGGGELLQEPAAGLAGRQLEMHLGPGRAPRPARPPPHDSGTTLRRDDALSRGHPVPGRRRGPGTTGSGAADSGDSAAGDSRRDRRDARSAPHRPLPPADLQAHRRVLRLARGLYGLARDAAYAGDGSGGDRPRDGSDSAPARRAPAPAEARRRGRGRGTGVIGGFGRTRRKPGAAPAPPPSGLGPGLPSGHTDRVVQSVALADKDEDP